MKKSDFPEFITKQLLRARFS